MTICALACGLIAKKFRDASRQRKAVEVLEAHEASVYYKNRDRSMVGGGDPDVPDSLLHLLGRDFWGEPEIISGYNQSGLRLNKDLTEAMLCLSSVEFVYLATPLEEHHMSRLAAMPNLRSVSLVGTVAPRDIANLRSLQGLTALYMDRSDFTTEHAAELAHLPHLSDLALYGGVIEADVFSIVSQMTELRWLRLSGSRLGIWGPIEIGKIEQLTVLYIDDTNITDEAVPYLEDLTNLEILAITAAALSEESTQRLQGALPECHIIYYPPPVIVR